MTSFPYLKIARDLGVPYGAVIRYAEILTVRNPNIRYQFSADADALNLGDWGQTALGHIWAAVKAERERRRAVEREQA